MPNFYIINICISFTSHSSNSKFPPISESFPSMSAKVETKSSAEKAAAAAAKKSKSNMKIPKYTTGHQKSKRSKKSVETYKNYIFKVLKQVSPDPDISSKAMEIMKNFINHMFEKHAHEFSTLARGTIKSVPSLLGRFKLVSDWFSLLNWTSMMQLRVQWRFPNSKDLRDAFVLY